MTTLGSEGFEGGRTTTVVLAANFHEEQSVWGDDGHCAFTAFGSSISGAPTLIVEEEPSSSVTELESRDH